MKITSEIVSKALELKDCNSFEATRISIDSRSVEPGDLFIAIRAGHEFVEQALSKGAVAAIIDDPKYAKPGKTILVPNTTESLKSIGKYIKNSVGLKKVIGITGSVGKTTTRTWLNEILNNKFKSFSSIKNYNTIYGLPISLSLLEDETDFGVFEMGSNNPGEIAELSEYLDPDIGIITNIFESHIGRFGNKEVLAKEKASIIEGIKPSGAIVFDGDSEHKGLIQELASKKGLKQVSVGFSESCDFRILSLNDGIVLKTPLGIEQYKLPVIGKHFAYITATIAAAIYAMGLEVHDFVPYFEKLSPIDGRGRIQKITWKNKTFDVIDDSYNASPSAMKASLDILNEYQSDSKIAVIGKMGELGEYEEHFHKEIAEKLKEIPLSKIYFIGSRNLWDIMKAAGDIECYEKIDNFVIEKILEIVQNNSIVLLKGSRSIELNKFLDYIKCSII